MNIDNRTIILDITSEDSITYIHTFPLVQSLEQPPVSIECKPAVPKLQGILCKHQKTYFNASLLYDVWCSDRPVKKIKLVDFLNTVVKLIQTTQRQCDIALKNFINTPASIFKNQGYIYSQHIHHKKGYSHRM
jgi:hypothetical protein